MHISVTFHNVDEGKRKNEYTYQLLKCDEIIRSPSYWLRKLESNMPAESESKRWVRMQTTPLGDSGITIQIGDVVLSVKQGFDHQVLVDVVRALTAVC